MQILAEAGNRMHGSISDVPAFRENKIAQARGDIDDFLDGTICQANTRCEVENAKVFKYSFGGERKEGVVIDEFTVCQTQLAQSLALCQELCHRLVRNLFTLM